MSDLVARLRKWGRALQPVPPEKLLNEAADEIERLEAELEAQEAVTATHREMCLDLQVENERLEAVLNNISRNSMDSSTRGIAIAALEDDDYSGECEHGMDGGCWQCATAAEDDHETK